MPCNNAITPKSDERSAIPLAVDCAPELDVDVLPGLSVACPNIGVSNVVNDGKSAVVVHSWLVPIVLKSVVT